jgi:hypothetical protein
MSFAPPRKIMMLLKLNYYTDIVLITALFVHLYSISGKRRKGGGGGGGSVASAPMAQKTFSECTHSWDFYRIIGTHWEKSQLAF